MIGTRALPPIGMAAHLASFGPTQLQKTAEPQTRSKIKLPIKIASKISIGTKMWLDHAHRET
jgi:hypothetical protein